MSSIFLPLFENCRKNRANLSNSEHDSSSGKYSFVQLDFESETEFELFNQLVLWHNHLSDDRFVPKQTNQTSLPRQDEVDQLELINQDNPQDGTLIRDKKLKFYRPRFYLNELNIRNRVLICILIRDKYLKKVLANKDSSLDRNVQESTLLRNVINRFVNVSGQYFVDQFPVDVLYFHSETNGNSSNLIVSSYQNAGTNHVGVASGDEQWPRHVQMLNYLVRSGTVDQYSFVFMVTEQTYIDVHNFKHFTDQLAVSELVISASDGSPTNQLNLNDFVHHFKSNLGISDSLLNNGLLLSSSLIGLCQLDFECFMQNTFLNPSLDLTNSEDCFPFCFHSKLINENEQIDEASVDKSITLYPIDIGSTRFHFVRSLVSTNAVHKIKLKLNYVQSDISSLTSDQSVWPATVLVGEKARTRFEVIRWIHKNATHSLMPNDVQVVEPLNQHETQELIHLQTIAQKWFKNETTTLTNIYSKFDAIRGLEYLVDVLHDNTSTRLQILKPLNPIKPIDNIPINSENVHLTLVLSVRGHSEVPLAIEFMKNYANVCLTRPGHQTSVIIVLMFTRQTYPNQTLIDFENSEFSKLKQVCSQLDASYPSSDIRFLDISPIITSSSNDLVGVFKYPCEMVYMDMIARSLASLSSSEPRLMLHCRVAMQMSNDFLHRVRKNTISGLQVFSVIPFVEYRIRTLISNSNLQKHLQANYSKDFVSSLGLIMTQIKQGLLFDVRKDNGYFDETNFEFASFYLSDYLLAREITQHIMPIARNHHSVWQHRHVYYNATMNLYHLFEQYSSKAKSQKTFNLMRSVDPDLRIAVQFDCERLQNNIDSKRSCLHRQNAGLGTTHKLAMIVMEHLDQMTSFDKTS